jgi:WD40 repeat protein
VWKGHSNRVLGIALSSDGSTLLSASADETIRIWALKGDKKTAKKERLEEERRLMFSIR